MRFLKDTPFAFAVFGVFLGCRLNRIAEAKRISMIAMKLYQERFNDPIQFATTSLAYYGLFAFIVLPLQTCAEKMREASIMSYGVGDVMMAMIASQNALQVVVTLANHCFLYFFDPLSFRNLSTLG